MCACGGHIPKINEKFKKKQLFSFIECCLKQVTIDIEI